jgi:hypothetical protein
MYTWYETPTKMSSIFFYDITQLYYILLVGQKCQMPQNKDSVYHYVQIIQAFIRHYDFWGNENDTQKAKFLNILEKASHNHPK